MKRTLQIIVFVVFSLSVIGLMGFIFLEREDQLIVDVSVNVCRDTEKGFLSETDLHQTLISNSEIINKKVKLIDTDSLEQVVRTNPYVENCDAFVNINNKLIINVKEKKAILRVFNQSSSGYYIDENAELLPLSNSYTPRVLIVNGHLNIPMDENSSHVYDSIYQQTKLPDLFQLTSIINSNPFLHAQISQMYINSMQEIDLVPQMGNQIIQLGDIENAERKFNKLEIFYKEALAKSRWEDYNTINLKFKNQVVCTRN